MKKSLIVVAISSPFDCVMDHNIETYVCTFDFSERALHTLVRVLCGEVRATGKLPGTFRRRASRSKSMRNWIVEEYQRARDGIELERLIHAVFSADSSPNEDLFPLKTATASCFELNSPAISESHFVVRNSSTNAVWGFAATYVIESTGIIGTVLVDPSKRNQSVGRSLHRKAVKNFKDKNLLRMRLGLSFPGVFPGIPDGDTALKGWFANRGWGSASSRVLTSLSIDDLSTWAIGEGLLQRIQHGGIGFGLILAHDTVNVEAVMAHVQKNANMEITELYKRAFADTIGCNVVRARDAKNSIVGTVVACRPGSQLSTYMLGIMSKRPFAGGIVAPVVPLTSQSRLIIQGLALVGVRHNKAHKAQRTVLNWVSQISPYFLLFDFMTW